MPYLVQDFPKANRMTSQRLIDQLFSGGKSQSAVAFPIRVVWQICDRQGRPPLTTGYQVLISVPKKRLHHAVDRNRVKRQLREAFRLHQQFLVNETTPEKTILLAIVWLSDRLYDSKEVAQRMEKLIYRMAEKIRTYRRETEPGYGSYFVPTPDGKFQLISPE